MKNCVLLCFYVPETHVETVKEAVFQAGAGVWSNYSHVAWQTLGTGQFKPLTGSNPTIGETDGLSKVQEYKVELFCPKEKIDMVIEALKKAHPYEEPGYYVSKF